MTSSTTKQALRRYIRNYGTHGTSWMLKELKNRLKRKLGKKIGDKDRVDRMAEELSKTLAIAYKQMEEGE